MDGKMELRRRYRDALERGAPAGSVVEVPEGLSRDEAQGVYLRWILEREGLVVARQAAPAATPPVPDFGWSGAKYIAFAEGHDGEQAAPTPPPKTSFQARVVEWRDACFGDNPTEPHERGDRLLEEVLEFLQSRGYPADRAPPLVDYVYGRPSGEPEQEVGGILLTLALSCHEAGLDMAAAGEAELTRVWGKIDAIREKQATKPAGPLPSARTTPPPDADGEGVTLSEAVMGAIGRALRHGGGLVDLLQRETIARAAIATDRAERPVVLPPGWVAVPREPTLEMFCAGNEHYCDDPARIWDRMLAAAPPCPGVKEGKGAD